MRRTLVVVLLLLISVAVMSQVEEVSITRKLSGSSAGVSIVVDQDSGKGMITWIQHGNNNQSKIYSSLIIYKEKKGKLKFRKPREVSSGSGSYNSTSVSYNAISDSFLVAWDSGDTMLQTGMRIHCRKMSGKGKTVDGVVDLFVEKAWNDQDVKVFGRYQPNPAPAGAQGEFLVLWYRGNDTDNSLKNESGLWSAIIEDDGDVVRSPVKVFDAVLQNQKPVPIEIGDIIQQAKGNFIAGYAFASTMNFKGLPVGVIKLDDEGFHVKDHEFEKVDIPKPPLIVPMSEDMFLGAWTYYSLQASTVRKVTFGENLGEAERIKTLGTGQHLGCGLAGLGGRFYLVRTDLNHVTTIQEYNEKGTEISREKTITSNTAVAYSIVVASHEGAKKIIILTQKSGKTTADTELRALLYKVK